jgi:negative regulator of flagellin synthesis FlgM
MSGKINNLDNRPVQVQGRSTTAKPVAPGHSANAPGQAIAAAAHEVKLTDSAMQLAALEKALAQVPDVDLKRVEEVRSALQSGDYKIDTQQIASKLMQLERALAAAEGDKPE